MTVRNVTEAQRTPLVRETSKTKSGTPSEVVPEASKEPTSSQRWLTLWLTDRDIGVFAVLAIILLILLGARWARLSGFGSQEIEIERLTPIEYSYRININTATWVEFAQLKDIGETLAQRIVSDRDTNGPFRSIEDLDRVKGIGPRTVEKLRPFLREVPPPIENRNRSRQRPRAVLGR